MASFEPKLDDYPLSIVGEKLVLSPILEASISFVGFQIDLFFFLNKL